MAEEHENHGHSIAAWTRVGLMMLGSLFVAFGVAFGQHWLDVVGVVVAALGLVAGKALNRAGFGAPVLHAPGAQDTSELPTQSQTGAH